MYKLDRQIQKTFVIFAIAAIIAVITTSGYSLALLTALIIVYVIGKKPAPHFTIVIFLGGLVLRLLIMRALQTNQESDFLMMYNASRGLLEGDMSIFHTPYFSLWAYQSAFVIWQAGLLKICDSIVFLKFVNALLSAGTICLLYRIMRCFVSESAAQIFALLLTLHPFVLTYHVILTNQIPSAFFMVLSLWTLVCRDCDKLRFMRYPLAGIFLQIGNMLRCEGIILIVAILAWVVFEILHKPGTAKRMLIGVFLFFAAYCLTGKAADTAVRASGINPYGLQNGNPDWKFIVGLNTDTGGVYSESDWSKIYLSLDEHFQITDETRKIQNEIIKERVNIPFDHWLKFLITKIKVLWSSDSMHWAVHYLVDDEPGRYVGLITRFDVVNLIKGFNTAMSSLTIILLLLGLCSYRELNTPAAYLPYFVFFSAFCAFLLIEVQSRYVYLPQLFVFSGSAYGIEQVLKWRNSVGNR